MHSLCYAWLIASSAGMQTNLLVQHLNLQNDPALCVGKQHDLVRTLLDNTTNHAVYGTAKNTTVYRSARRHLEQQVLGCSATEKPPRICTKTCFTCDCGSPLQ